MMDSTSGEARRLARQVLYAFLLTFIAARVVVLLIMTRVIPDLFLHVGGTHVHHLNYGIFLIAGVGAYLLFGHPHGRARNAAAAAYGIGLGLTFDEFGMWLHLGGPYWQRASFDAIVVIAGVLALIAYAPAWRRIRAGSWAAVGLLAAFVVVFAILLARSAEWAGKRLGPRVQQLEMRSPK